MERKQGKQQEKTNDIYCSINGLAQIEVTHWYIDKQRIINTCKPIREAIALSLYMRGIYLHCDGTIVKNEWKRSRF
jgi:hypothetical protein